MKTKLKIIDLLSKKRGNEQTILQIAKAIGKSYAHINKECRELIEEGIFNKKIVGNAILCSLNFSNDKTIGYLVLSSTIKKPEKKKIKKIKEVLCIFQENKTTYIVSENKELKENYKIVDKNFLRKKTDFSKVFVLSGFENFWRCVYE